MDDLEEDDRDVVDTSRDLDRLNLWASTVTEGLAGIFLWIIGFAFLFLSEAMAVRGKECAVPHTCLGVFYIPMYTLNTRCRHVAGQSDAVDKTC